MKVLNTPSKSFVFFLISLLSLAVSAWEPASAASTDPKFVEGAKKEGRLDWWTTANQEVAKKVTDAFMKKYPFVKANYWRSGTLGLNNKVMMEAQVGRQSWDVLTQSPLFFTEMQQRQLIAPYDSPERSMISDDLKDRDAKWTAIYVLPYGLGFNTDMVKRKDVPKTYNDLLLPKWKGKNISVDTQAFTMLIGLMHAWGREQAIAYFKKLAAQDPVPGRGNTRRTQAVAAGEFPLVIAFTNSIEDAKSKGAPIDWVHLEPVVLQPQPTMLGRQATHPNAGRLFIDFLLSKEGQTVFQSLRFITTRRDVRPIPPRLIEGYKRVVLHPDLLKNAREDLKLYRSILGIPY